MATDTYTERFTVRATQAEKDAIDEMAEKLDLSRSRYVCQVAAGVPLPGGGGADAEVLEALDAISEDLREIREAINKAGRNVNQVAHHMNKGVRQDVDAAVIEDAGAKMREAVSVVVEQRGVVEARIEAILDEQQPAAPDDERAQERFREAAGAMGGEEQSAKERAARTESTESDAPEEDSQSDEAGQSEGESAPDEGTSRQADAEAASKSFRKAIEEAVAGAPVQESGSEDGGEKESPA